MTPHLRRRVVRIDVDQLLFAAGVVQGAINGHWNANDRNRRIHAAMRAVENAADVLRTLQKKTAAPKSGRSRRTKRRGSRRVA